MIVFLMLWISEGKWGEKFSIIKRNIVVQLILAFCLIQLLGLFHTENLSEGWLSMEKKIFLFLIPLALATTMIRWKEKEIRLLFYFFATACFAGMIICLIHAARQHYLYNEGLIPSYNISYLATSSYETLNPSSSNVWLFFSYVGLSNGISMHPAYFSLYITFSIVFLLHEILTHKHFPGFQKTLIASGIFLFTLFVIFLSSRIMIISLIIIYATLIAYYFSQRNEFATTLCFVVLLTLMIASLFINPVSRYRNVQEISESDFVIKEKTDYKISAEIRASLWWLAWKAYRKSNPLIGAGTGDVSDLMKETSEEYQITNVLLTNNPHNQYLYLLISNGPAALVVFILILLIPLLRAWTARNYLLVAFTFLFASLCLTETAFELQKGIVFFALIFSVLLFQSQAFQTEKVNLKFSGAGN